MERSTIMLKIYKSHENGPLTELSLKTLENGAWINIVAPTPYELKVVGNLTEVEPDFLRSALDDEERSIFYFNEMSNVVPEIKSLVLIRLYSLGRYEELIESFEELKKNGAFERDLESAHFNYIIGMSYYEMNKPYDSLKYLINSDRIYPTVDKKTAIAKNYIEILKFELAHKYLEEALKIDDMDKNCLFLITETSYYLGNYYLAIEYANKLLSHYQYDKAFHVLGAIYFDLGDDHNAFESLKVGNRGMLENWDYNEAPYTEYIMEIASRLSKAGYAERAENIYNKLQ